MAEGADRAGRARSGQDYRQLPPEVRLEDTIASVDPGPVPDPEAGQNIDQVRALRDD